MVDGAVDSAVAAPPAVPIRRRRPWQRLWVLAPVFFLVLLAVARIIYWRSSVSYAPMRLQGHAHPAVGQPTHVRATPSGLAVTGPPGTQQLLEFAIHNDGIHPVDINSVSASDDAVVEVRWAANTIAAGHRVPTPSHPLPVHVPRYAVVNLQLMVRKPACAPGAHRYLSGRVVIHWHAMISPHASTLNLLPGRPGEVDLCGPR